MGKTTHEYPIPVDEGSVAMTDLTVEMGERSQRFLRTACPTNTAKAVARQLNEMGWRLGDKEPEVSYRTVERWLEGRLPSTRHLLMLCVRWPAFLTQVLAPLVSPTDDIDRRFEQTIIELNALREEAARRGVPQL